jgi:Ca-activated chloride channel family protein
VTTFPHLASPGWLWLLAAIPLLLTWRLRAPAIALTYSRAPREARGAWRARWSFYARLAAFALAVVALARPQLGYAWEEAKTEGIDIEIALDVSGSMAAEDFQPRNRLEVAKSVIRDFIGGRPADRIGLVAFAGAAVTRAPLTNDQRMLVSLVDGLEMHQLPEGTAIGMGLANSAARLRSSDAKSRVIVLVTDGVNNAGEIDPRSAAAVAKGLGIRVYTVGVGRRGTAPMPITVRSPFTGREEVRRVDVAVEVDEALLTEIAQSTGGRFFRATDAQGLRDTFGEIDQLEKTTRETKRYVRYREAFPPFVWGSLALALLPLLASFAGWSLEP